MSSDGWSFWIDRGGTFTDVIGRGPDGTVHTLKLPSASGLYADAAVVAFLHSDLTPVHELAADHIARKAGFAHVTLSHQASPLPRFIARAQTAVADAYLTPVLQAHVDSLTQAVGGAPLYFMTSA